MGMDIHKLSAYNSARGSDNPLHKDDAARSLGYAAGLVPGVDMYAYVTYAPVKEWGEEWLRAGTANVNLSKPVYEGDACEVAIVSRAGETLEVELRSGGSSKASASFSRSAPTQTQEDKLPPARAMPSERPVADEISLAPGTVLGTIRKTLTREEAPAFLNDMRDDLPLYMEKGLVHPGFLLRMCNWALSQNVKLGPWIHTESRVHNHAVARLDEPMQARPVIAENYEKRGHRWVEVDVHLLGEGDRPLCTVRHVAIYRPRPASGQ